VAEQEQQGPGGRFLEDFQERVGTEAIELVDTVDDADAPTALACGRSEERDGSPYIGHRDFGAQLAVVADRALEREQIAVRLRGDAVRDRMLPRNRERLRRLHVGRRGVRMREHETRHAIGQRRLADAGRSADQPGMRHAPAAVGVQHLLLGVGVAMEREDVARVRRFNRLAVARARAHDAACAKLCRALPGSSLCCTIVQISSATRSFERTASISTQRSGACSAAAR